MTARRPDRPPSAVEVAGWVISARGGKVYVTDAWPGRDAGIMPGEAKALATTIAAAAAQAERQQQRRREVER